MALTGVPRVIIYGEASETYPASANAASSFSETPKVGNQAGTGYAVGTGSATTASVQANVALAFTASVAQTLDLKAVASISGATKSFNLVRAIVIKDQGDATAAGSVAINNTGVNAWTNGPFTTVGVVVAKGGEYGQRNATAAGWAVTSTNKVITFTPSAHATTLSILILGE